MRGNKMPFGHGPDSILSRNPVLGDVRNGILTGLKQPLTSVVFAPPSIAGGVKSLYFACEALSQLGRSSIIALHQPGLATWFAHSCPLYDGSYRPDLVIYPEIHQPRLDAGHHICFALGKHGAISPHAEFTICRSDAIQHWVTEQLPGMPVAVLLPSINRAIFKYRGEQKQDQICYMTRVHKHPEMAGLLRERYGPRVVEIVNRTETEVAHILKTSRVFVTRGNEGEGSPRPPKEALVAGCVVVGLKKDLNPSYHTDFGVRCDTVEEVIERCADALRMPIPSENERSCVRDLEEEKRDLIALIGRLHFG
jgi:hypothetical protein